MNNRTRYIPAIITLLAAFVACVVSIFYDYSTRDFLLIVMCTIVVFFIVGMIAKVIADHYLVISLQKELDQEEESESSIEGKKDGSDNVSEEHSKK